MLQNYFKIALRNLIAIGLLTVGFNSLKTALSNSVNSIKVD
jgi:hypothetical protein